MIYKKYYLYKEQVSLDNGVTWEDVTPAVTAPSGDPIASYSTLEECEGITSCTCADFTYSPTAFTVSSAATSVTFSYTGCTKPDLTSAATYNWIAIGNHTYDTWSTTGSVIANVSANTSSSRTATLNLSLSGTTCQSLTISQESGEEPQPTCDCDSFVFEGVEETGSTASITLSLHNGGSTSLNLGVFEIFTTESSVQVPVNYQIAAGETKDVLVADYGGNEGNTVVRVEGTISNTSYCFTFTCPNQYCDLIDGDTLTVEVASATSCS